MNYALWLEVKSFASLTSVSSLVCGSYSKQVQVFWVSQALQVGLSCDLKKKNVAGTNCPYMVNLNSETPLQAS
jgi:hypothetical protein